MISPELFRKYDVPVPRYTSYPTVPHWTDAPTTDEWQRSLALAASPADASLALYVHVPFCESLCTFCGCNTVITRDHGKGAPYVDLVLRELDRYLELVPALASRPVRQLHLGGGTPTFLSSTELSRLIDGIGARVQIAGQFCEGSIEVDPRVTSAEQLQVLFDKGITRVSLGVQDIDPEVQRLVNRRQPLEMTKTLCASARAIGYSSINVDLIYGLPGQTIASTHALSEAIAELRPDRLAVYSFALVPWIKPAQRKFKDEDVPAGEDKRALYEVIRERLLGEGYVEIGLDHFALPTDSLARAAEEGTLHRNFMGYAERRTDALVGLGVSAISETADCYHQNEKVLAVYERRAQAGELPTLRGHKLTLDDRRRRAKILSLMTTFQAGLDAEDLIDVRPQLEPLAQDAVVQLSGNHVTVPVEGRPFLRNAAACFDAYLHAGANGERRHSRSV